ncbi:MAG: CheR family methyltransferase [Methylococcaceae bacterium]|jgi:chemotaxis protein methyltransferase CheR
MELTDATYETLRAVIHQLCGLALLDDRKYLIRDRLGRVLQRHALNGFDELALRLMTGQEGGLETEVVDTILTGETSFLRDPHVFAALAEEVLPDIVRRLEQPGRPLRIFSAGVSTGQEAYSLAMVAQEHFSGQALPGGEMFSIRATDISARALSVASAGIYHARDLERGLDADRRGRYFDAVGDRFKVKASLRERIAFSRLNFMDPLPLSDRFDLICCRNVMIYFDEALRRQLCQQFHRLLQPQGWLVLGAAENLYGLSADYRSVQLGRNVLCYRRNN